MNNNTTNTGQYKKGAIVNSKVNLKLQLLIIDYRDDAYYCDVISESRLRGRTLTYFESEIQGTA